MTARWDGKPPATALAHLLVMSSGQTRVATYEGGYWYFFANAPGCGFRVSAEEIASWEWTYRGPLVLP